MPQRKRCLVENGRMLSAALKLVASVAVAGCSAGVLCQSVASAPPAFEKKTEGVMLGTGAPYAAPDRFGPATAILVHGTPYLIDCGPGVVRRVAQAHKNGVAGLTPQRIGVVFINTPP